MPGRGFNKITIFPISITEKKKLIPKRLAPIMAFCRFPLRYIIQNYQLCDYEITLS